MLYALSSNVYVCVPAKAGHGTDMTVTGGPDRDQDQDRQNMNFAGPWCTFAIRITAVDFFTTDFYIKLYNLAYFVDQKEKKTNDVTCHDNKHVCIVEHKNH